MTEVQSADRGARRATLVYLLVATVFGVGCLLLVEKYGQSLSHCILRAPRHHQLWIGVLAVCVLCLPLLLSAAWLWWYGVRVIRGDRHPPEGTKVVRYTLVARGVVARRYGRLYQTLAGLFAVTAITVVWLGWKLWRLQ